MSGRRQSRIAFDPFGLNDWFGAVRECSGTAAVGAELSFTWPAGQLGGKLDDYQNFARVYRATDWEDLMAERTPNKARLKGAAEFRRALMTGHPFAAGSIRPTLYTIAEQGRATAREEDPKSSGDRVLHGLRDYFGVEGWMRARTMSERWRPGSGRSGNASAPRRPPPPASSRV